MYSRELDGKVYTFGVTGKLWRNAFLMYDHQTGTFWSHFTGEAILGPLQGARLRMLTSVPMVKWEAWRDQHPETLVLSVDGWEDRRDSYEEYHSSPRTGLYKTERKDRRLWVKERIVGVVVGDRAKAYPHKAFKKTRIIQDDLGGTPILVFHDRKTLASAVYERRAKDGSLLTFSEPKRRDRITDNTGRTWNLMTGQSNNGEKLKHLLHLDAYWFAWADYYPLTDLYKRD